MPPESNYIDFEEILQDLIEIFYDFEVNLKDFEAISGLSLHLQKTLRHFGTFRLTRQASADVKYIKVNKCSKMAQLNLFNSKWN